MMCALTSGSKRVSRHSSQWWLRVFQWFNTPWRPSCIVQRVGKSARAPWLEGASSFMKFLTQLWPNIAFLLEMFHTCITWNRFTSVMVPLFTWATFDHVTDAWLSTRAIYLDLRCLYSPKIWLARTWNGKALEVAWLQRCNQVISHCMLSVGIPCWVIVIAEGSHISKSKKATIACPTLEMNIHVFQCDTLCTDT